MCKAAVLSGHAGCEHAGTLCKLKKREEWVRVRARNSEEIGAKKNKAKFEKRKQHFVKHDETVWTSAQLDEGRAVERMSSGAGGCAGGLKTTGKSGREEGRMKRASARRTVGAA